MSLTSNCDALARLNESAFNNIIREVMLQRPSLFNYATKELITSNTFCSAIPMNPVLESSMNVPKVTEVDKFPIIGAPAGTPGVNYCMQITEMAVDFNPSNQITLPPELNALGSQEIALKGTVCAGIACKDAIRIDDILHASVAFGIVNKAGITKKTASKKIKGKGLRFNDFFTKKLNCFCLSFYAKARVTQENVYLKLKVTGIEIQDLTPVGLENAIECYMKQVLDMAVLPKMKIALIELVYNVKTYFTVGLAPVSPQIPFNPDVSNNELSVFVKLIN